VSGDVWLPESAIGIDTPEGKAAWERPPTVGYEEMPVGRALPMEDGRKPVLMLLEGKYAELDRERFLRGEICVQCQTCLPECPSALGAYKRIIETPGFNLEQRYQGFPGARLAKERLMVGRCPVCGTEMSPEMAQALFGGEYDKREGTDAQAWRDWSKWGQ
jgi:ferredoxin